MIIKSYVNRSYLFLVINFRILFPKYSNSLSELISTLRQPFLVYFLAYHLNCDIAGRADNGSTTILSVVNKALESHFKITDRVIYATKNMRIVARCIQYNSIKNLLDFKGGYYVEYYGNR